MGTLYLVRHGQASFGADDYDNLSPLGHQQSVRLGEYLAHKGLVFDAVLVGTLKRHAQTLAGIQEGMKTARQFFDGPPLEKLAPSGGSDDTQCESVGALLWSGLNEYDSHAVISAVHSEPLQKPDTPELYRNHFRILRGALTHWMNGTSQPVGMPSYPDFQKGVTSALDHVSENFGTRNDANVLIVSSGGPISTAVGHILGTTPEMTIELNLRIRNTSITEFNFNPKRHTLVTYNTLPHFDHADYAKWVTYS